MIPFMHYQHPHMLAESTAPNLANIMNKENAVKPPPPSMAAKRRTRVKGSSSVSITGNTPTFIAQQAAVRHSRRSHSPVPFGADLDNVGARMSHTATPSQSSSEPMVTFRLPTSVPRPRNMPIVTSQMLEELDSELAGVPVQYIKDQLLSMREMLLRGLAAVDTSSASLPPTGMPREVRLKTKPSQRPPTHLFCVVNEKTGQGHLYPFHALVLVAHCATLPEIPTDISVMDAKDPGYLNLRVVGLSVPHLESFHLLFDYFYTKNFARFLAELISLPSSALPATSQKLTPDEKTEYVIRALSQTFTTGALVERLRFIHGLWCNVVKLGIHEEGVWKVMNTAWQIMVAALRASTAHLQPSTPQPPANHQ
ncbi:hypothetical protein FRC03_005706 [Tulasnella sp. 419]|nr:hypothetical protein FRC02_008959 [Tulasnella sp. 418]KAG8961150.1 hypothetical protein FRC03_005706 [Tulasnella sp. 419]